MLSFLISHAYAFMVPISLVEGPLVALAGGAGAAIGRINPYLTYLLVMIGAVVQDVSFYWLGRWAIRSERMKALAMRARLIRDGMEPLQEAWRNQMWATLVASKFAYGLYAPLIVSAGVAEAPFAKFIWRSLLLSAVVLAAWLGFGFAFGKSYAVLGSASAWVSGGLAILAVIGLFFVGRAARRRVARRS